MSLPKTLPKALLFDADGTLYDSERINYEANRRTALQLHNFDFSWEEFDEHIRRGKKSGYMILEEAGITVDHAAYLLHKLRHFEYLVQKELSAQPGLLDFLDWCKAKHIRCAVVSASRRSHLSVALDVLGIAQYFELIISMEDIATRPKPDPYGYKLALQRMKITANQALVIEDTPKGITAALAAHVRCVAIRNTTNEDSELLEAEHVIDSYNDLRRYLLQ